MDGNQPAAESTASQATQEAPAFRPCRHCQALVEQPKRRGQVKDFCTDRHRAAFRDAQAQASIQNARDAIQETMDELARLSARLEGSDQLLARFQRHGRRPRQPKQPAAPSPELSKALTSLGFPAEEKKD